MTTLNDLAGDAYRAVILEAEAAGLVADEGAAVAAARDAVIQEIQNNPTVQAEIEALAADAAAQRAHRRAVENGKRQIDDISTGQLRFAEMDTLDCVVPLGDGLLATLGRLDDRLVDMADEVRRQNVFRVNRKYQEWSDGFRRPVKDALRPMPAGSTVTDAVEQGRL